MPGMALREFECSLCQGRFTLLAGDLVLPGPRLCDACARRVWNVEGEAHLRQVVEGLPGVDGAQTGEILRHLEALKAQWGSAEELLDHRARDRAADRPA